MRDNVDRNESAPNAHTEESRAMTSRWKTAFAGLLLGSTALINSAQALNTPLAEPAGKAQFTNLVIIGDSLSDTGNIGKYVGGNGVLATFPGGPGYKTGFLQSPYYGYRFSNGPIYADTLGTLLHASGTTNDLAVGGAYSGTYTVGSPLQVAGIAVTGTNLSATLSGVLPSLAGQTASLSGISYGSRDLAVVYGGANDAFATLSALSLQPLLTGQQQTAAVTVVAGTVASNIAAEVTQLYAQGVRNFVVPNIPALGLTPAFNGTLGQNNAAAASGVSGGINQAVAAAMAQLSRALGVNITVVDTSALITDMATNPAKYGLTDVTHECLTTGSAGNSPTGGPTVCGTPNSYLFWDTVHPTTYTQQIFSQYVASILQGPTTVAAQGQIAQIATQGAVDGALSHTDALRRAAQYPSADLGVDAMMNAGNKKIGVYLSVTGGQGSRESEYNAVGFHYTQSQAAFGTDVYLAPNAVVGLMADFGTTDATLSGGMGNDRMSSTNLVGYGAAWGDNWYGTIGFLYGFDKFDRLNRNTFVAGQVATANADGKTKAYYLKLGPTFHALGATLMPSVGYQDVQISIGSESETGAVGMNQAVGSQSIRSRIVSVGGEASYPVTVAGYNLLPSLHASWNQETGPIGRTISTYTISQPGTNILTPVGGMPRNFFRVGTTLDMRASSWLVVNANFDAVTGGDRSDLTGTLQARISF